MDFLIACRNPAQKTLWVSAQFPQRRRPITLSKGNQRRELRKMEDRQLYEQILGIGSPWVCRARGIEAGPRSRSSTRLVNHQLIQTWSCGECGQPCALYDH